MSMELLREMVREGSADFIEVQKLVGNALPPPGLQLEMEQWWKDTVSIKVVVLDGDGRVHRLLSGCRVDLNTPEGAFAVDFFRTLAAVLRLIVLCRTKGRAYIDLTTGGYGIGWTLVVGRGD